jgi:hypothetical protein
MWAIQLDLSRGTWVLRIASSRSTFANLLSIVRHD